MHKRIPLKRILRFTLKQQLHVSVQSPSSGSALFELAKVTVVTSANSNNVIPDDSDSTETCRSCFNIDFNILFKAVLLCNGW